ncbi:MAG: phosphotriesterase [Acidobacteriota bacterium]|jgi:phosphotriesterase-related protein
MERRTFLASLAAGLPLACRAPGAPTESALGLILTVRGPLEPSALGTTLVHEHLLVDFAGADQVNRDRYDADEVFETVLPHLVALRECGCQTLIEATPAYLGRDPLLLRRLSEASALQIVTNTGYYGANDDKHVPEHAYRESPRQLADRWTREFRHGIEGTDVRPGFLKIGVDSGALTEIDRKLVEAAALCHLDTGLTIAVHTGKGAAREVLGTLTAAGVAPAAWVWVHAQNEEDRSTHAWAASEGAWVEFDGVGPHSMDAHADAVVDMTQAGYLDHVLVSQDAGWYHVGERGGGSYRSQTFLFEEFVPVLHDRGLSEEQVRTLLVDNPARAFAIGVRRLDPPDRRGRVTPAPRANGRP